MASTLMLLANPYRPDPRVQLEAKALAEAGHRVTVLAWSRDTGERGSSRDGAVEVVRVGPRCPFRSAAGMLTRLPRYWLAAMRLSRGVDRRLAGIDGPLRDCAHSQHSSRHHCSMESYTKDSAQRCGAL